MSEILIQRNRGMLMASRQLLDLICGNSPLNDPVSELVEAFNAFMMSLHAIKPWRNATIESVEVEFPERSHIATEPLIRGRFPMLGYYQFLASTRLVEGAENHGAAILVADAVNDLKDIAAELAEVGLVQEIAGDEEAILALGFRYTSHLYMHIPPLRMHLEELLSEQ